MEENKLSEFAKLIQEGKKARQEAEENKKKNFLQMYNLEEENMSPFSFLAELAKLKKETEEAKIQPVIVEEPVVELPPPPPPQTPAELLSELASLISESKKANTEVFESAKEELEPFVESIIQDIVELKQEEVVEEEPVIQDPLIDRAVKSITKVAENTNLFSTPAPEKVPANIKAVQDKIKYLEQWIGKISAAGPGSGSYSLNDLSDTDHASIVTATDGQVLTYNDTMKKWIAADGGSGGTTDTYARTLAQNSYNQANTATTIGQSAFNYANTAITTSGGTITGDLVVTGTDSSTGIKLTGNRANIFVGNGNRDARTIISFNSLPSYYSGVQITRSNSELWFAGADYTEKYVIRRNNSIDAFTVNSTTGYVNITESLIVSGNVVANGVNIQTSLNAVNSSTQSAYDQANNAISLGQSAYGQANSATSVGQSGYNQANNAITLGQSAYSKANTANTLAQAAFNYANTAITVTGGSITGRLNVTYTPPTITGTALNITAANTVGGIGYADFLKITNTSLGATNPNKSFRLDSAGTLQILNSAYSNTIFSVTDAGFIAINAASGATDGVPINNGISMANNSYIFDDGNYHITSKTGAIWLNANDGSAVNINTQMPSGITGAGMNVQGAVQSYATGGTAFIAGTGAISGVALQMPRAGAIRDVYNGASTIYFDVSTGGTTAGDFQFRSTNSFTNYLTINSSGLTSRTPSLGKLPWNSAIDTELTIDNYRFRVSNQGGNFPQIISNTSGTVNSAWTAVAARSGSAITQTGSTGALIPNNSWTSLYSSAGMDNSGDTVTVTLQDKGAGRIYRVTFMRSDSGSVGYNIIAERLL